MPELPEAYVIAQHLHQALVDHTAGGVTLHRRDVLKSRNPGELVHLQGRRILAVQAHAKVVLVQFEDDWWLVFRLGMTGQLFACPPWVPMARHTHLVIDFEQPEVQLRFRDARRFGGICLERAEVADRLSFRQTTGEDVLRVSEDTFVNRFDRSRAPVKAFLLDQTHMAGLGNIYIDESLFDSGIHPEQSARSISRGRRRRLYASMVRILRAAIDCGGSSINDHVRPDGTRGYFQRRHAVYGKAGRPCPRCGRSIRKITVAGRSTHLCTRCQRR